MSKHTAGEWKARKELHNWCVVSPTRVIASIGPHTANNDSVEAEANAHLMAASPVMYKALKFIADREHLFFAECCDAEEIIAAANAAIALAEGK
jgi:hypothetical protein